MNKEPVRVLFLTEHEKDFLAIDHMVQQIEEGLYTLDWQADYSEALERIKRREHKVYLLDYTFGQDKWSEILKDCKSLGFRRPIIVLTDLMHQDIEPQAIKAGAADCLIKEYLNAPFLDRAIRYSVMQYKFIKEHQLAVKAREFAEASSRAKTDFIENVSYEIRTPMNGIIGMTELVLETALNHEQRDYLETVKCSANGLMTVINDLFDLTEIEEGNMELNPIHFSLRNTLSNTVRNFSVLVERKKLKLTYNIHHEVPDHLYGDPSRLRQILYNLLNNAIKFTECGQIGLSVKTKEETDKDVLLHFAVRDTGIGISEEKHEIIFQPFTKGDTFDQPRGIGIGLAISKHLVELFGGQIHVNSEPGKGSTFYFTARLNKYKAPYLKASALHKVNLKDVTALIIDDNSTNRRIFKEMLEKFGMKPIAVGNAQAAIIILKLTIERGIPFTVVLTDLHMPDIDGFELAKKIREQPQMANTRIIMLTSAGRPGDGLRCRELGIDAYLNKPVNHEDLLDTIRIVLSDSYHKDMPLITRHTLRESRRSLNILLAEDDAVNQKMTKLMLEKWGHTVTVTKTGKDTLDVYNSEHFDLVLMDIKMPDMDGTEVTASIREMEKHKDSNITIIALTACASKNDRQQCLAAGMNDFVSKPVDFEELFYKIEKATGQFFKFTKSDDNFSEVIDKKRLFNHFDGDGKLLRAIVEPFINDCPKMLAEIHKALADNNSKALERAAHTLKGTVSIFAAKETFDTALKLEAMAEHEDLFSAESVYYRLEKEMEKLKQTLMTIIDSI